MRTEALSVRFKFQNIEVDSVDPRPVARGNGTASYAQAVSGYVAQLALFEY